MKTEIRLSNTLRELMASGFPLEDISVTLLTKKCKINRQSFYYHFHDIYDLLTLVFLNEKIDDLPDVKSLDGIINAIYKHYIKNKKFIDATLSSAAKDLYEDFLRNNLYQTLLKLIAYYDQEKVTTLSQRKDFSGMYAAAFSQGITHYLSSIKNKNLDGLCKVFASIPKDFIHSVLKNIEKTNKKK